MLLITIPIILIVITVHEFAHAKVADMLGDPTPRLAGRLTLNPIDHIDPIGLLMLILVRFGWAKPVPINPYNFRNPKIGSAYVSIAGPLSNFLFAWMVAAIYKSLPIQLNETFAFIFQYTIWINLALAIFNLIPIPPLDGFHILEVFLPSDRSDILITLNQYGFFILVIILLFPGTSELLFSAIQFVYQLLV